MTTANDQWDERVVISGMSGLYPEAHSVRDLSHILYNKINPVNTEKTRWKYEHPEAIQYTGKVPGLMLFDAQFFKVHYRLANNMDAMARKVLEQAFQAIYDAGINPDELNGKKVGVYIGSCFSETEKASFYVASSRTGFGLAGCSKTMFANRLSYWLNAKGPSMAIDDACCSSSSALEQAYLAIKRGDCEAAVVGGTNLCLHPQSSIHYGRIMKISLDGKTKSFDTEAAGCGKSEAVNVLFLQKAKNALRVYAEVVHVKCEFTSILQDESGPKYGFYRDPKNMANFISKFYEEARVSPRVVEYVEAFGSAIPEVDKAELEAIDEVFCKNNNNRILVGSVMSNIGYGEAASGISAITKVLLGYHRGQLAGNLNCDSPRKDVAALREGRMSIVTDHQTFDRNYTAINGLSTTGVNAHILLNGHYKPKDVLRYKSNIPHLVTVSGRQESSVSKIFEDLKSRVIDEEELALLRNIHKTRISGHLGRGFIILDTNEKNETISLAEKVNYHNDAKRPLWFVYSGMGSQWPGMGAHLMRIPVFAAAIERCHRVLESKGVNIVNVITSPDNAILDNILNSFVGITAIQIGLTDVLRKMGIFPKKIIGHSSGELVCAYADGCFTAEETILSAYYRGLVSAQTPFIYGSMAAVGIGYKQISKMCPPEIEVACHNGPDSSTISGPADVMRDFLAQLTAKNIFAKEVPCSNIAYHSRYIADAGPGLLKYMSEVIKSPKARSKRWVSTSVPLDRWNEHVAKYSSAEYHTNNLLNPVLFEETCLFIPGNAVLVEIAPHGLLQAILKRSLPNSCSYIPLTRRGHPDNVQFLLEAIGDLYMEGYYPNTQALYPQVEFPVSTRTPMLSHLIEWVHNEKWNVPLYASANRKAAAACTHVISIHDDEHLYLKDHVIRGKNTYPFAATLVAVWDTLAMSLGVTKKKLSVQFRDVHLHSQPLLHDQRQLRLSVILHRGTGRFEVLDDSIKVANGLITSLIKEDTHIYAKDEILSEEDVELDSNDIYELLNSRDYSYSNEFRCIYNANVSLTKVNLLWQNNWVTFIDSMIQIHALRRSHESVSQPKFIRSIQIDVEKHSKYETLQKTDATLLLAKVCEIKDNTQCGGVIIDTIIFSDLPSTNRKEIILKSLKFVPHVTSDYIDEISALCIFLKVVAENLNKNEINVKLVEYENQGNVAKIEEVISVMPEVKINLTGIGRGDINNYNIFLQDIDLLMVHNLAKDEDLCHLLRRVLNTDTYIINKEYSELSNICPSSLYRSVLAHSFASSRLELIVWQQPNVMVGASAVTVLSENDINRLSTQWLTLPATHKVIILSAYPAFKGLKELIKQWRNKDNRKINLVLINQELSDEQLQNRMPLTDLSINILQNGILGGEYYLPVQENISKGQQMALKITPLDGIDHLRWILKTEVSCPGIQVKVQYAGLNDAYIKRALGIVANEHNNFIEYDFSGTIHSNVRVMGIVQAETISADVKLRPQLLWPVPEHWSLEDAATVPLAYCMAFYCLFFKSKLYYGNSILVHGGAGALGQAIISIAQAYGCEIYTTVGSNQKKLALLRMFPELKENQIGYSRDISFADMVMNNTKGQGCNIVINCVTTNLRHAFIKCCSWKGYIVDMSLIMENGNYEFEMNCLNKCITFTNTQFSSIFEPRNANELNKLQLMVSEGIARGYVRPLPRVAYASEEAARALRLQAGSKQIGRVLLSLKDDVHYTETKISCTSHGLQLLFTDDAVLGVKLAERLMHRGAKKLEIHCITDKSKSLLFKSRSWEKQGVQCTISYENTWNETKKYFMTDNINVEGIYYIVVTLDAEYNISKHSEYLTLLAKTNNWSIKYFTIIDARKDVSDIIRTNPPNEKITTIKLPLLNETRNVERELYFSKNDDINAVEKALCCEQQVVAAYYKSKTYGSLLEEIADVAGIPNLGRISQEVTLKDLGMDIENSHLVKIYLRDTYNIVLEPNDVPLLTTKKIHEFQDKIKEKDFTETEGLETFFSLIDPDELQATTDMLLLPTLTTTATARDDEFDVSRTSLCIIPGVEGLHLRFRVLCEQLKLPVLVLQPGFERPHETIQELARRYAEILLKKAHLQGRFYLLGYESGVLVALEMAVILEEHGLTGTVFCIGGGPEEVQAKFEEKLAKFKTEESLQIAVARHMLSLLDKDNADLQHLEDDLKNYSTWKQKVAICVHKLMGRIDHSRQYARQVIEAAYLRTVQVRLYNTKLASLRSLLISIRPSNTSGAFKSNLESQLSLQDLSQQQVVEYDLRNPLAYATQDLRCAAIINRHLDKHILEEFRNKNLCETYITNANSFMTKANESVEAFF